MAHQITLTDEDYAALSAAAARTGESIEELAHQAIAARYPETASADKYRFPAGAPMTKRQREAMERLAQKIGGRRPWASEIVIEDRGPR